MNLSTQLKLMASRAERIERAAAVMREMFNLPLEELDPRAGANTDTEIEAMLDDPEYKKAMAGLDDSNKKHFLKDLKNKPADNNNGNNGTKKRF